MPETFRQKKNLAKRTYSEVPNKQSADRDFLFITWKIVGRLERKIEKSKQAFSSFMDFRVKHSELGILNLVCYCAEMDIGHLSLMIIELDNNLEEFYEKRSTISYLLIFVFVPS